ncbi:MAG: YcxB family protein [Gemmatimonadota bacterium]
MNDRDVPSVDFELTPEEWEDVNAAHLFASSHYDELISNARKVGALLFATLSALCFLMGFTLGAVLFAVSLAPFVYLVGPMQRQAQRKALAKLSQEGVAHGLFGHHRVEVREDGLFHRSSAMETLIRWHAVDEVVEREGHFFVYTGANSFLPIPVTAFSDSDQLRAFSEGFHRHLAHAREGARLAPPSGGEGPEG